jgi:hypothetical protein
VKAFSKTLKDVFKTDVRFLVPMYQRPYVWKRERQWEPLWEDAKALAERLLLERQLPTIEGEPGPEERTPPHFLGAVVLDDGGKELGTTDKRLVIDGQQRLTTLQLLLAAVAEIAAANGETKSAAQVRKLIENGDEVVELPEDRWKVWPTNYDRSTFVGVMGGDLEARKGDDRFANAFRFFHSEAVAWVEAEDEESKSADRVSALATALQLRMQLVSIELEKGDNPQVIFETLNDRGERLLAADLVKNYVFQHTRLPAAEVDALYETSWKQFDVNKRWREEVRQGRLKRPRIDVFLQHWLSLELGTEVLTSELFEAFKRFHTIRQEPIEALLRDLAHASKVFDRMDAVASEEPLSVEGTFVLRWRRIDASTFTPALLYLFRNDVQPDQRRRGLLALESFLVRRLLCQWTTKQYNQLGVELAAAIKKAGPSVAGESVETFFVSQTADSRSWPSDADITKALTTNRVYSYIRQDRVCMVLVAVENELRRRKNSEELLAPDARFEIEHVLPQGWRTYWRFDDGTTGSLEQQTARDWTLHQLGNLTITNGKINKLLSNHPWTEIEAASRDAVTPKPDSPKGKRTVLAEHTVLHMNKAIVDDHVKVWDEAAIAGRQLDLIGEILGLWPRPTGPGASPQLPGGVPADPTIVT